MKKVKGRHQLLFISVLAVTLVTVMAGIVMPGNAQAFGSKMADSVEKAEALDTKSLKIKSFSKEECRFGIKDSVFKKNKNLIIISAILKLDKGNKEDIEKKIREILAYRKGRHPELPSAGSVFVNREKPITNKKIFLLL